MTPKLKKIILIVFTIVILFLVYAIFIKPDPTQESLIGSKANTPTSEEAKVLGAQISQALLRIEQIKLEKNIFENELYRSLKDRSRPIAEEPIGRSNPFAPLGDISVDSIMRNSTSTRTISASTSTNSVDN